MLYLGYWLISTHFVVVRTGQSVIHPAQELEI